MCYRTKGAAQSDHFVVLEMRCHKPFLHLQDLKQKADEAQKVPSQKSDNICMYEPDLVCLTLKLWRSTM